MFAIIIAASIGGIGGPSLQSIITQNVPATEQGAAQGALGSVQGLAAIFGPLMATSLFGYFTSASAPMKLPGAAFLAASLLVALGVLNTVRTLRMAQPATESAPAS